MTLMKRGARKRQQNRSNADRPRGGATTTCPVTAHRKVCGALSKVLRTTRDATTGNVLRKRQCTKGHRFTTEELPR